MKSRSRRRESRWRRRLSLPKRPPEKSRRKRRGPRRDPPLPPPPRLRAAGSAASSKIPNRTSGRALLLLSHPALQAEMSLLSFLHGFRSLALLRSFDGGAFSGMGKGRFFCLKKAPRFPLLRGRHSLSFGGREAGLPSQADPPGPRM